MSWIRVLRCVALALLVQALVLTTEPLQANETRTLVEQLVSADVDETSRAVAAARLQDTAEGREAIAQLLAKPPRVEVVTAILKTFPAQPDPAFLSPLLEVHATFDDPELGERIRSVLFRLPATALDAALLARADDAAVSAGSRRDAVALIGYRGDWRQIGTLLELLESDPELAGSALAALQRITRIDWGADRQDRWQALWQEIREGTDASAYRAILAALVARQAERLEALSAEVQRYLDPADPKENVLALGSALPDIRAQAAHNLLALASRDPKTHRAAVATALLERLARETHPRVNAQLARGAGTLEIAEAEPHLVRLLVHVEGGGPRNGLGATDRRELALQLSRALGHLRSTQSIDSLAGIAAQPWAPEDVQVACLRALGRIGGPRAFEHLARRVASSAQASPALLGAIAEVLGSFPEATTQLTHLLEHAHPDVRARSADSLGKLGSTLTAETARPVIAQLAKRLSAPDERPYVRASAVLALGEIREGPSVPPLSHALLNDDDALVRRRSAEAFQRLGRPEAVPTLEQALRDADGEVRTAAWSALKAILSGDGGAALLARVEKWYEREELAAFAVQVFETTLAATPAEQGERRGQLERRIARCQQLAGRLDVARPQLQALHERSPDDLELALWFAEVLSAAGASPADLERALELLSKAPAKPADRRSWQAQLLRLRLLLARDPQAAKAQLEALRLHDPALGGDAMAVAWKELAAQIEQAQSSRPPE